MQTYFRAYSCCMRTYNICVVGGHYRHSGAPFSKRESSMSYIEGKTLFPPPVTIDTHLQTKTKHVFLSEGAAVPTGIFRTVLSSCADTCVLTPPPRSSDGDGRTRSPGNTCAVTSANFNFLLAILEGNARSLLSANACKKPQSRSFALFERAPIDAQSVLATWLWRMARAREGGNS